MTKLKAKQEIFCREYVKDWNGTQAAIRAGYAPNSANVTASKLLTKANIKAFIDKLKENIEETLNLSALRNVQELMKIAYSDASNLRKAWSELKDFEQLSDEAKATIEGIQYSKTTFGENGEKETIKVKQYNKLAAIKIINEMMGYNAAIKSDITTTVDVKTLDPDTFKKNIMN